MKVWSKAWTGAACAAVLGMASSAQAHDLSCTKRVNGQAAVTASTYPFTANYSFEVTNTHPTLPSLLLTALDPLLLLKGFSFPQLPILIPVGESITRTLSVVLDSFDDCETLALIDGNLDANFDNSFTATFDLGLSVSTARVTCGTPTPDLTCGAASRTLGYYQSHLVPLTLCLVGGPIDLGPVANVLTDIGVQGILWGNPDQYLNGTPRNELDRARFLLAQQILVATCNQRLFGKVAPDNLLADARESIAGLACGGMELFTNRLRTFNGSCARGPFPPLFITGPATPLAARALGIDPSLPTLGGCVQ
ncbi:hypothetical protein LXT21_20735 [Myxococcus sp. K38C18041901]|uniref:hypothetical protein n=1 Tax=Myxococcus guangdongensis TaxID=2906760 RepID=UPI0020A7ACDE|nr:hypothetical protein [Myxococcus guangdongensis]MCP3061209.1 hypothetical protein [Myxococcus guangdongensis]